METKLMNVILRFKTKRTKPVVVDVLFLIGTQNEVETFCKTTGPRALVAFYE